MSLNFPNTPTDGQTFTDASGQQWIYEASTNSWTAVGLQGGGISYKGAIDVTAAAPAGVKSGWMYSVSTGGTPHASFNGLADPTAQGGLIIYDGAKWENISSVNIPPASESVAGVVELATAAETTAGTDATRAVHPAGLKVELDKKVDLAGGTMTGGLTVPSLVSTGDVQAASLNGGQLAGFRNQLINGNFHINQRGGGPFSSGAQYTSDRWKTSSADRVTVSNSGPLNSNSLVTTGAAMTIAQGVELVPEPGRPGPFVQGSVWTVSVWATAAINLSVSFLDTVIDPANASVVRSDAPMTATSETNNGFTKYAATFTVGVAPNATNKLLQIGFNNVTGSIALAQLEPGPVATPYEYRPYGTELALCQRYFWKSTGTLVVAGQTTGSYGQQQSMIFPVQMRATPTMTRPSGNCGFSQVNSSSFAITATGNDEYASGSGISASIEL